MAAPAAPCNWDVIECGCDLSLTLGESGAELDQSTQYAIEVATFVLWALSGRQFGTCELSFRPCRQDCQSGLEDGAWGARLRDGNWINLPCRSCAGACACTEVCEVRIPATPANSVTEVIMNGVVLDETLYRLEDSEWLVLSAEAGCFPSCQDMSVPLGDAGSWGVRFTQGIEPPTAGKRAAGALACEILKACKNDSSCCLPKRTQSFTRQGISAVMLDPMEFFERNRTGIYEVDLFLIAVNPDGRSRAARIVSPDSAPRLHLS